MLKLNREKKRSLSNENNNMLEEWNKRDERLSNIDDIHTNFRSQE